MAMMMAGRVLLVCVLCVLWCGAGGGGAEMNDETLVDSQHLSGVGEKAPKGLPESGERGPDSAGHSLDKNNGINSNLQEGTVTGTTTERVGKKKEEDVGDDDGLEEEEEEAETDDDDDDEEEKEKSKEKEDTPQAGKSESSSKEVAATIPTASGLSGVGGGSPSGVDDGGSNGSPNGIEDLNLEVPGPVVNSPSPLPNAAAGGLQNPDGALPSQKNNFSETGVHSGTTLPAPSLPKPQAPAITQPKAEEQSSTEQDTEYSPDIEEVTTVKEKVQNTVETGIPSRASSAASKPPVQQPTPLLTQSPAAPSPERLAAATSEEKSIAPSFSAGEGSRTATNVAQNSKEEKNEKLPSENETESKAVEQPSGNDVAEENSPARTTASPIPASGGADDQRNADADNSNARVLKSEGTHKNSETGYTNLASTAGDAATQTEKAPADAKTNDTTKPGDSDGSTAVSHTTSPLLLLLLVACAAAAAVASA
ncbi:Mucin-associated surface protein (MASP) [Trypanosoma cruzi]|uniref:Mucin-associated surface protein (MASP), putative n=2 Tax=Trypanosoma cruzi TaxID=5693 RepID=Q4DXN9_TRYCC|nr:mucin-associated surface protein (MASP), putative [Trypanosoma cruzi]EAN97298.1 mucin-associated surface protein (MASP), putative [Trypanosoma cruzi]PWV21306.1 Mucin-associated surface protein (MASP) [Trypanosoma cruzi]|eukprot:XP_819149.1 mucin-associated surface protein (MASP) [Trypanosoma cruzi strain CL Brener]